jgi:nicotinamidase-related amidase
LLIFECQEEVIGESAEFPGLRADVVQRHMVENLSRLLEAARAAGVFVAYCNMAFRPDGLAVPNTPRYDQKPLQPVSGPAEISPIVPPLEPLAHELVIDRIHGMAAFHGTPLESALRDRGVTTLIPTGVSVNIDILATTVETIGRGFRAVIARDCVAGDPSSYADDVLRYSLRNLAYITDSQAIAERWGAGVEA